MRSFKMCTQMLLKFEPGSLSRSLSDELIRYAPSCCIPPHWSVEKVIEPLLK